MNITITPEVTNMFLMLSKGAIEQLNHEIKTSDTEIQDLIAENDVRRKRLDEINQIVRNLEAGESKEHIPGGVQTEQLTEPYHKPFSQFESSLVPFENGKPPRKNKGGVPKGIKRGPYKKTKSEEDEKQEFKRPAAVYSNQKSKYPELNETAY